MKMHGLDQPVPDDERLGPALTMAAPTKPPMSAWEELVGRPDHQVNRFQTMAPEQPGEDHDRRRRRRVDRCPCRWCWPPAVPKTRKATKLKKAAQTTAWRGERTRVETTVAMELAASWKPLMKSKASATSDDEDDEDEASDGHEAQLVLTTMPSMMLATSSQRSAAISSRP